LARYFTLVTLDFHDTSFSDHVAVGLHAIGVDEHRRPFVPTFWTNAIRHGYLFNSKEPDKQHINESVHWSVVAKRGGSPPAAPYNPPNLPASIPPERIAAPTSEEQALL
jgi:hypothetical protein